ncbi:NADPH-dependent glutamate synthase [Ruminococcaceae bacterium OttesenSCG-928-I18]|nr:NADPH-dependent glutamate synthase [Ruminococcaceae bacterium OttesenSCG-928-I18]
MPNMEPKKTPMPAQDPAVRQHNFNEVALGYTHEMAVQEAQRCLQCKHKPCVGGCPVAIDIPGFIAKVAEGDMKGSFDVLSEQTSLPAVCGRVCPQETQCEAVCVRGIKHEPVGIGRLERYVADWMMENGGAKVEKPTPNGHRVAVVGAGPAGLTTAGELARKGYAVTIFEALHKTGGVLVYGIPEFRLPKAIVQREIDALAKLGVEIRTNMVIGKVLTVDELFEEGFEAIFIGSGAGLPVFLGIPGENLNGVVSANEFLTRINLMGAWKQDSHTPVIRPRRVAVVGGGNVAMDAARCAKRLGAEEVHVFYRRTRAEMPARIEEIEHAEEEGILFQYLISPLEILGDEEGKVKQMHCLRNELGEPDASGRRRPVPIEGSNFYTDLDGVIIAIGNSPNPLIRMTTPGLEANKWGCLVTKDERGLTTRKNVWAGGDVVTGAATVILAMGAGKQAAAEIDEMLAKA